MIRGTARRIALAVLAAAVVGGGGAGVASLTAYSVLGREVVSRRVPRPEGLEHRLCRLAPSEFRIVDAWSETVAYDAGTREANSLGAPPLGARDVLPEVGASRVWEESLRGATVAVRVAEAGPCSLLVLRWPSGTIPAGFMTRFALLAFAALFALGLALAAWVVLPFLGAVQRVRVSAAGVGSPRYVAAREPRFEDLDAIAAALDGAHAEIVEAKARLEARHAALEEHLRAVAHDVRTPLASLSLTLESLGSLEALPAAGREAVDRALDDVVYLGGLAENLALEARFRDRRGPERVPTELVELVRRVVTRFRALSRRVGGRVEASLGEAPLVVSCDPVLIEQALSNLVHNALVHGGPAVTVIVALDPTEGGGAVLRVVDDGPGFTVEAARAFRAGSPQAPSPRGSGRGLLITSTAIALHGGRLELETSDKGSALMIEVPPPAPTL